MKDFSFITADGIPKELKENKIRWKTFANRKLKNGRVVLYHESDHYFPNFFKIQIIDFATKKEDWYTLDIGVDEHIKILKKILAEYFGIVIGDVCKKCGRGIDFFAGWSYKGMCYFCNVKEENKKLLTWDAPKINEHDLSFDEKQG